jgi:DNA-directed RNA polymerase subunit A'
MGMLVEEGVKTIDAIKFSVFSPNEIRRYSVAEISAPETYDEDGMPVTGGLMDSRLGTLEPGQKCATCGNTSARCPGHFGHIELAEPVLHIAFVEDIRKVLVSTCRYCGRLLLPQEEIDTYRAKLAEKKPSSPTLAEEITKEIWLRPRRLRSARIVINLSMRSSSPNPRLSTRLRSGVVLHAYYHPLYVRGLNVFPMTILGS